LPQQQFRQPVPRSHQIPTTVLTSPHQITGRFLGHRGNRHLNDLSQMQQPGQMRRVARIGFDPIPSRALQFRRRRHQTVDPGGP
jgi:hypothetical protein